MFNNRKAPRFSNRKYRKNVVDEQLYKSWKLTYGRTESFSEFKKIWSLIAEAYMTAIIDERDGARLGGRLGELYLGLLNPGKQKPVDYKTSLALGKTVYHQNWETNGKIGKVIYAYTRKNVAPLCKYWAFKPCRNLSTKASKAVKANSARYKNSIERRKL